ncbi:hypothetical protein HN51_070013 [Arachis hypogaea]|uniref:aluminum-activated malate transporter 12-like isoform X1 n=1 Tax=Arachis hypogaea TaxID=3818 RepID=UPI0034E820F9|nr:Aluminum-activated malate transporter [Arachis hypogaea]
MGLGRKANQVATRLLLCSERNIFRYGATLCKGLNRGSGTLLAGSLAFIIGYIVNACSRVVQAIFIGAAVFLIGAVATYTKFFPYIKKNYDYGIIIFLLTFNLIMVSSYSVDNVLKIAHDRIYTIAIGCGICLLMSLLIFPIGQGKISIIQQYLSMVK